MKTVPCSTASLNSPAPNGAGPTKAPKPSQPEPPKGGTTVAPNLEGRRRALEFPQVNELTPSKTNPRKQFEGPDWPDFVANIRLHGVIQPLTVRPVAPGFPDRVKYEIVAGERRWRAAREAKLTVVPVVIQDLTDAEVVEVQQVENLQRADLTPLEEAQGYADWRALLVNAGAPAETAVDRICLLVGKKRSVVYQRLALLKTSPAVQEALKSGRLDLSKATLVAMVPDERKQEQFLKEILNGLNRWHPEPLSFRAAEIRLVEEYRRLLKGAPFDQTREYGKDRMKGGGFAGPCASCPNRSGNFDKEQFAGNPNVCLNIACFDRKKDVAGELALQAAKEQNRATVDPKTYNEHRHDFKAPEETVYADPKRRTISALAKKAGVQPAVTVHEREGAKEVFTPEQVVQIKKATGISEDRYSARSDADKAAERKKKAKQKAMTAVLGAAIPDILAKLLPGGKLDERLWPALASAVYDRSAIDRHDFMAKRLGISKSMNESREALSAHFETERSPAKCRELVVELLLLSDTGYSNYTGRQSWDEQAETTAKLAGIDLDKRLQKYEETVWPCKGKKSEKKKTAKRGKKGGGK